VLDCRDQAKKGKVDDDVFKACVDALSQKLVKNEKLQKDKELYLRADRGLPYGRVLLAMARVREAGITKFGLIAEPEAVP
jgi:biopolymer transport protein TolR